MKKIEDYIHLYIGCDVIYPNTEGINIIATMTGVSKTEIETTYKNGHKEGDCVGDYLSWKSNGRHNCDASHVKLLLRPLSSMTEEEAKELCKMQIIGFRENEDVVSIITMIPTVKFIIHHKDDPESQIIFNIRRYLNIDSYTPSQFLYLTQHGFDILNLIDTGLALDATKIEKV